MNLKKIIASAWRRLLYRFTARRPCRLIGREGQPYLERYFLFQAFGLTAYLHRFVDADGDLELHDHPFDAMAVVLAGRYVEEVPRRFSLSEGILCRKRAIRFFNWIPSRRAHRIDSLQPETWTLFVHNRRKGRTWGFFQEHRPLPGGNLAILYHQPYPLTDDNHRWWESAKPGARAGREPLPKNLRMAREAS